MLLEVLQNVRSAFCEVVNLDLGASRLDADVPVHNASHLFVSFSVRCSCLNLATLCWTVSETHLHSLHLVLSACSYDQCLSAACKSSFPATGKFSPTVASTVDDTFHAVPCLAIALPLIWMISPRPHWRSMLGESGTWLSPILNLYPYPHLIGSDLCRTAKTSIVLMQLLLLQ